MAVVGGVPAGFEDMVEAYDVGGNVGIGVGDAVAHAGLGGQVDHHLRVVGVEQLLHGGLVGYVALHKHIVYALRLLPFQLLEAVLFQRHVVVVV